MTIPWADLGQAAYHRPVHMAAMEDLMNTLNRSAGLTLCLAAALLIAACSSGGAAATGTPASGGPTAGATGNGGAGATGNGGVGTTPAQPVYTPPAYTLPAYTIPPQPTWPPVGGTARFINVYVPGTSDPFPIDVMQSGFGGQKLATVPPFSASDYLDPGDSGDGSAEFDFLPTGVTDYTRLVMEQGWSNMAGKQISVILFNDSTPPEAGKPNPGATYVIEEKGGTNPRPTPGASDALLWTDVQPLDAIPNGEGWPSPAVGVVGGSGCLQVADASTANGSIGLLFGQQAFRLPAGATHIGIWLNASLPKDCTGKPDFGPIDVTLEAGKQAEILFYGLKAADVKSLTLPIGQ